MGILTNKAILSGTPIFEKSSQERVPFDSLRIYDGRQRSGDRKICHEMDHSGSTDHSFAATREEGELYDTKLVFKQSCSMLNSTATVARRV